MNRYVTRTLVVVSLAFNVLFTLFIIFALSRKTAVVTFFDLDGDGEARCTTGACIVSVPVEGADMVFGPVSFSLKTGSSAALQYSAVREKNQANISLEPLYDRELVSVEQTGFGLIIRGIRPGETVLQTLTGEGIRDIARITVKHADE